WECQGCHDLKLSNRPVRTRMPGGVAGVPPIMEAPYADFQWHFPCHRQYCMNQKAAKTRLC
ncbi:hypothetical protein, partial [Ramlibacter sp. 2FC]|uniref:hypothetical protein n=1 Tax=Ramlibacter sp. 2FC TaxID=2502188 RepID=UPI001BB2480C